MRSIVLIYFLFVTAVKARFSCDQVPFVDRTGWGAREPKLITNLTEKPLSFYVIHHTYQPANCYDDETCIERVRSIQITHQDERGWDDIGYHFLIGENGKVYQGRGWDRQGAHAPGFNNDGYGICIIGDFSVASPNETALNALRSWMDCGVEQGYIKDNYIITHRQSQRPGYTVCPGNGTVDAIKDWPRYCSFQNSGMNLTENQTQPSIARLFCAKELASSSSTLSYRNLAYHLLLKVTYFIFHKIENFIQ